ncbi:MAG: prepilin-type N-terminal cleavage/methylation domain-containing protein [Phycisphaerales bacterium]
MTHARTKRAFTLIEVLVATIILGLGVLGLSALFAGAATQQASAAAVSRSVAFGQGGLAIIGRRIGELVGKAGLTPLPDGTWDALSSDDADGVLRSQFALTPTTQGFFFRQDAAKGTLRVLQNANITANVPVTEFEHTRVDPRTVAIRVIWGDTRSLNPISKTYRLDESDPALAQWLAGNADPPPLILLHPNGNNGGVPGGNPSDVLRIRHNIFSATGDLAEIQGRITSPTSPPTGPRWGFVTITVEPYQWLNNVVASVNDRLSYVESDTVPGGRLPTMGYAVLYRELAIGVEATIFTYALRALGAPRNQLDELPFIPPDTRNDFQNDEAVLREVAVDLGRDPTTGQYYITPVDSRNDWIVEPGQILLMSSITGVANVTTTDPGADTPVRVVTVRTVDGERRAILDDSPRIGSRSVHDRVNSDTQTTEIHVWAVAPIVESRSSDSTEWQLTPIEARTFKLIL